MAAIPAHILEKLTRLNLSGYEWKVLLYVICRTLGKNKDAASITLSELEGATGIKKSHLCRTITMLEERMIIHRLTFRAISSYSFNSDNLTWKIGAMRGKPEIDAAFERWFSRYPVALRKDEAREAYFSLISEGESTIDDLDKGLAGYLKWTKAKDQAFGREANPLYYMLPHNFLKDKKYVEYANLSEMKTELEVGGFDGSPRKEGPKVAGSNEKVERYKIEREKMRQKLLDERMDEVMEAEEKNDIKTLQAIKADIDAELVKFSRTFWGEVEG
jgi:phage replication O-like protein O